MIDCSIGLPLILPMYAFVPNYLPMFAFVQTTSKTTSNPTFNVTFQTTSKNTPKMLSKDLKEKVAVSLLRRHSENDYFRNRLKRVKRELTFSETNQISMLLFLRMIVLNDCLLRWIAAMDCCETCDYCDVLLRRLAAKDCMVQ